MKGSEIMEEGTELGKAYVQIIPSAKGISGKIKEALGDAPAQTGESAGQSMGSSLVGKLKAVIVSAGIGAAFSKALTEGAALEQSIGGVETLFKDSADTIKQYAAEAYKTAGVSANDYMEQVTSFSASLLQSLGGDTEKAAEYANRALVDMSDNANKMGTDIGSIQLAYQGFAKANYTMLDNLKLGYGGTKEEMARLIRDASKMTDIQEKLGVTVDSSSMSFGNVVNAISVMQESLEIAGTTSEEAATTISGSMASVKAAFSNVLAGLTLGQDIQPALNGLADTVTTFFVDNLLPAVWNILSSLPGALTTFAQDLGPQLIGGLINSINQELPGLGTAVGGITATIAGAFAALKALAAGQAIVSGILSIAAAIKTFIAAASFASSPIALLQGAFIAFVNPVGLIVAAVGALTAGFIYLWNTCEPFKQFWIDLGTNITNFVSNAAQAIVNFFTVTLPTGIQNAMTFIQQLPDNISAFFSQIPYMVGNFLGQALGMLESWAVQLPALAKQAASTFLTNVVAFFCQLPGNTLKWLTTALTNVAQWAVQLGKKGTEAAKTLLNNVVNGLMQLPGKLLDIGRQAVEGLWNGIKAAAGWLQDQIGSFVSGIVDGFTRAFKIGSPSRIMRDKVGRWITPGIAEGITGNMGCLKSAMTDVRDLVTGQIAGLQTGVSTALSVDPAWAVPTVSPQSSGSVQPVTLDELADLVALIIRSIRENGGPIIIGDEVIGRANDRYRQNRAIMTGGMA